MRIGLISDTHGLLRPEALTALRGSDRIVHAGDVGHPDVLEGLATLAPVHAIRGNVDEPEAVRRSRRRNAPSPDWARDLPTRLDLDLDGIRIVVVHAIQDLPANGVPNTDVVVCGHSHVPRVERRNGVLVVNPGSAGPRRFRLPVTVGWMGRGGAGEVEAGVVEIVG